MCLKLNKTSLDHENVKNLCTVYEYDLQSFHQGTEFTLGDCLLGAARSIKNVEKNK